MTDKFVLQLTDEYIKVKGLTDVSTEQKVDIMNGIRHVFNSMQKSETFAQEVTNVLAESQKAKGGGIR